MRKNFVLFALIPLVALCVVLYIFLDGWIEAGLETAGEEIVGARVEIDRLALTLSPVGVRMARLQVANPRDPWKNLFETGRVAFAMNLGQLLRGKYIVETMEVNDLIIGTRRTTDGSLPESRRKEEEPAGSSFSGLADDVLTRAGTKIPLLDLAQLRRGANLDSLVRAFNFQTPLFVDSVRRQAQDATKQWDATLADVEATRQRIAGLEASVKAIKPAELKSVDKVVAAIQTVDNARKTINDITRTLDERQKSVRSTVEQLSGTVGRVDDVAKADLQRVMSLARLPDLSTMGIAEILLGPGLVQDVKSGLYWVDFARTNVRRYQPEPAIEKPPRMRGQNIHFPVERAYPKFWIRKILVSGGTDRKQEPEYIYAKGQVTDVSSDQRVTGLPLKVALEGTRGGTADVSLAAVFDRTKETPLDEYRARMSGIRLAAFPLGSKDFLPSKITNATLATSLTVSVPGSRIDARAEMAFRNVAVQFEAAPRTTAERLARDVIGGIRGFDAGLRLWNTAGPVDMAFTTNLDDQFASRIKEVLGAELVRLQNELRAKVDARIAEKKAEFERWYAAKRQQAEQQLAVYQSALTQALGVVDGKKKELNDQLEKVKKGTLDGVMKDLFKKK